MAQQLQLSPTLFVYAWEVIYLPSPSRLFSSPQLLPAYSRKNTCKEAGKHHIDLVTTRATNVATLVIIVQATSDLRCFLSKDNVGVLGTTSFVRPPKKRHAPSQCQSSKAMTCTKCGARQRDRTAPTPPSTQLLPGKTTTTTPPAYYSYSLQPRRLEQHHHPSSLHARPILHGQPSASFRQAFARRPR